MLKQNIDVNPLTSLKILISFFEFYPV